MAKFLQRSRIAAPVETVFDWHTRHDAFERLAPPWEEVRIQKLEGIARGDRVELTQKNGPLRTRWVAVHGDLKRPFEFRDFQLEGPFARWEHVHRFVPDGDDACFLEDDIDYTLPAGSLGDAVAGRMVENRILQAFAYRHAVTVADIEAIQAAALPPMRILLSGATGLIGGALRPFLTCAGHTVVALTRSPKQAGEIGWEPATGKLDATALEGFDAVIHLAGESIAAGRWNPARKARIVSSRVDGTRLLAEAVAGLSNPPQTFLSASAIGYYGDRPGELLTETSEPGSGFLAETCTAWEAAARPAAEAGIRVVHPRFGAVLSSSGGALAKMLPPFVMGAGGRLGSGRQAMSWIALDDVVGALYHLLATPALAGPVNLVAPHAVTNAEMTRRLAEVLRRPAIAPAPAAGLKLALGEMANELLLADQRIEPAALTAAGYAFRFPELDGALRHLLGRRQWS